MSASPFSQAELSTIVKALRMARASYREVAETLEITVEEARGLAKLQVPQEPKTIGRYGKPFNHGRSGYYRHGCKCAICRGEMRNYEAARRAEGRK